MFLANYTIFEDEYVCTIVQSKSVFNKEMAVYPKLKTVFEKDGWLFNRVETGGKDGIPDIFIAKGDDYYFIEVKMLHKKALKNVADDLKWQFGQLAFLKKAAMKKIHYILLVVKESTCCFIRRKDETFNLSNALKFL